jgi:threonine dehydrogenase-like Zn-dependent dehydrogenase
MFVPAHFNEQRIEPLHRLIRERPLGTPVTSAAMHAGDALRAYQYSPRELAASEVEITITHCGICHSDLHLIDNDWSVSSYPLVPGHEIVGTIAHARYRAVLVNDS